MSRTPVPEGLSVDAQAFWIPLCGRATIVSPPCRVQSCLVARAANRRREDVREMPYLPSDAHVGPAGVSVLLTLPRYTPPRSWNL